MSGKSAWRFDVFYILYARVYAELYIQEFMQGYLTKFFSSIILLLITIFAYADGNPYLKLKFDKVVMYDFSGSKDWNQYIVDGNGRLVSSVTKQVGLDNASVKKINSFLGLKSSFGAGTAACFSPHLGFVYYFRGKVVAYITICLECNVLVSSKPLEAQKQGKVGEGKDAYYTADGLSQSFRLYINSLLKKFNFSHQIKD